MHCIPDRPLVAGSIEDGVCREAVAVRDSPGVGLREEVFRDFFGEIEVAKSGGGGRDKVTLGSPLPSHGNTRRENSLL